MPPKKGDPNKPKGRMSAYAFFVQNRREHYKKQQLKVEFADFSRECSDRWKRITDGDKEKFIKKAQEDKVRYDAQMKDYVPPPDATRGRGRRKKRDPNLPKRPLSAFMFFCQDKRPLLKEKNPRASIGDIAKDLGKAWKVMNDVQKEPYEAKAKTDRKRYEVDKEEYAEKLRSHNDVEEEEEDEDEED